MFLIGAALILFKWPVGLAVVVLATIGRLMVLSAYKNLEKIAAEFIFVGREGVQIDFPRYSYLRNVLMLIAVGVLAREGFMLGAGFGVLNMVVDLVFLRVRK